MLLSEHVHCAAVAFKMTEQVRKWICIRFCIKLEHSSVENYLDDSEGPSYGQLVIGSFITTTCLLRHQDLMTCDFWLFPKLKSPLKGKRFQTINEMQENTTGQLKVTGRTVWGPKVPTLKGTEASLSCVQCFLHLVSSSTNVSIFHTLWLDTF